MDELKALRALATELGVHPRYTDGLGKKITVAPDTLIRISAALGAEITRLSDAPRALEALLAARAAERFPPVVVAWDGFLPPHSVEDVEIQLETGQTVPASTRPLPMGYHRVGGCTIIAAPVEAWRRPGPGPGSHRSWGVGTHLAALRSRRSRSLADLRDLESLCRWIRDKGGDLVTVLPILPTFNSDPADPSPYSPVSRLFWSELILDLEGLDAHRPVGKVTTLDVQRGDAEVRAALAQFPVPEAALQDGELVRYAHFRGAQTRLGRNWRSWPAAARAGRLGVEHLDAEEERYHLAAQTLARRQLHELRERLDRAGVRLGLDLAVGVHPDGYDPWSRQSLFGDGMSVGAPPDVGFPSGQDWGFSPVLPEASRREGHRYLVASIAHQARLAGVLRVDHIMAWTRLYWIPHGMGLHEGTYVSYPAEELFAILTLESHRHHCEVVGENLGNVPPEIDKALPRHRIWGMYLAQFQDWSGKDGGELPAPPTDHDMALIGTHDTPTFAGWLAGHDIGERVRYGLLAEHTAPDVRKERSQAGEALARRFDRADPRALLADVLDWLGRSESPLVVPWLEDLWLEDEGVNLPGTPSSVRPNWQRPMRRLLDDIFSDLEIDALIRRLDHARTSPVRGAR